MAKDILRESFAPTPTSTVGIYLIARGIDPPWPACIRQHPRLYHRDGAGLVSHHPAMVCPIRDIHTDEVIGCHRTYLAEGGAKADVDHPKKVLGRIIGGAIKLSPDEDVTLGLGVCEGIETGLVDPGDRTGRPSGRSATAGNLAAFPVLPGIEALTIFGDNDDDRTGTGEKAARECAARWRAAGREVTVYIPKAAGCRLERRAGAPLMDARGNFGSPEERFRAKSKPGGSPDRSDLLILTWLQRELPPRDWLLENMLCTTSRWLVIGATGVGKTLVGLDLALALASGANFLHWKGGGQPRRVMYLDGELPAETLKERIQSAAALYGEPAVYAYNRDVLQADDMPPLNSEDGQKWLLAEIATVRPDVIIFDNIPCLIAGMLDEEHWKPVQAIVRKLTANRIAQVWLDQTGFNSGRGYGTKSKEWAMDTVALLSRPEDGEDDGPIRLEFTKARLRLPATAWLFKPVLICSRHERLDRRAARRGKQGEVRRAEEALVSRRL